MNTEMREAWETMLSYLEEGRAIIVAGDRHGDLPELNGFNKVEGKDYGSRHLGFGYFEGRTEHGRFEFCGGGAMNRVGNELGWSPLDASPEVLADLGYDFEKAKAIIRAKLA